MGYLYEVKYAKILVSEFVMLTNFIKGISIKIVQCFLYFSIGGVVLVSFSNKEFKSEVPLGALWALLGALLYAIYLVLLRRRVDNEDKLNMPMFLGMADE